MHIIIPAANKDATTDHDRGRENVAREFQDCEFLHHSALGNFSMMSSLLLSIRVDPKHMDLPRRATNTGQPEKKGYSQL